MREGMLPVTERVGRSTLALPFFIQLEDGESVTSAASLREVIEAIA